jgi:hypothetical protein
VTQQLGLAFASAAFSMSSTPSSGRAARCPDRSPQQVNQPQQQKQQEQPSIAEDFTADLSPEERRRVQAYADRRAREAMEQVQLAHDDPEMQRRQLRIYAAADLLAGAKIAALSKRIVVAPADEELAIDETEAEPAAPQVKPKRGPGRPKADAAASRQRMPPVPHMQRSEESEAPVPAGPRRPQPTVQEVLDRRPAKPPQRRVG